MKFKKRTLCFPNGRKIDVITDGFATLVYDINTGKKILQYKSNAGANFTSCALFDKLNMNSFGHENKIVSEFYKK